MSETKSNSDKKLNKKFLNQILIRRCKETTILKCILRLSWFKGSVSIYFVCYQYILWVNAVVMEVLPLLNL